MTRSKRFVLALAMGGVGWACAPANSEEAGARPVRAEAVAPAPAAEGLRYSAILQPYTQIPLAFKVSGYVSVLETRPGPDGQSRPLQEGDLVRHGSVLAQINPAEYQQRVQQAGAQLAEAEAGLDRARADAARAETLYQAQALTRPDYDAAMASLAAARARADAGKAALEQARLVLADCALSAPADTMVLSRSVEIGALAAAGTVGFTLADLTRVKAVFGVPDQVVGRLRLGAPLSLTTDAFPGLDLAGRVTAVSPSADPQSRVFSVEITVPNPGRRLKAGMIASVEVDSGASSGVEAGTATVPVAAVVKSARPGGFAVFVVEGDEASARARVREVALGAISGNRVAVATGLAMGERVIVSGASLLVDGDRVRLVPDTEGE